MINSVAMMLDHSFNRKDLAKRITDSVNKTIEGGTTTPDLGGNSKTTVVTNAIIKRIEEN